MWESTQCLIGFRYFRAVIKKRIIREITGSNNLYLYVLTKRRILCVFKGTHLNATITLQLQYADWYWSAFNSFLFCEPIQLSQTIYYFIPCIASIMLKHISYTHMCVWCAYGMQHKNKNEFKT